MFKLIIKFTLNPKLLFAIILFSLVPTSYATIVQFKTSIGDFEVNLYDKATPQTVANFLKYVNSSEYETSIIHRSEHAFVIQGGGFKIRTSSSDINGETITEEKLFPIETYAPIINEPVYSNRRATIAMAKVGNAVNSATSQWFINLADNHQSLDSQNGGFTVFGEVIGNGMEIVDAIAALPKYNLGGALTSTPIQDYSENDYTNEVDIKLDNFVQIEAITVVNSNADTADMLTPIENTYDPATNLNSNSNGGSFTFFVLASLLLFTIRKTLLKR